MRKELIYEYKAYPPAEEAFKCLCNRLGLKIKREDVDSLQASTEDRSLIARLSTETNPRGGMQVVVEIRVSGDEHLAAVLACFGSPTRERRIAPSSRNFAEVVVKTEFTGDVDAFVETVCERLGIARERFGAYRAMVLTTANMPGAAEVIKEAAKKLRQL